MMKTTIERLKTNVKRLETIERNQTIDMVQNMSAALTRRHALTLRSLSRAMFMLRDAERLEQRRALHRDKALEYGEQRCLCDSCLNTRPGYERVDG